MSDWEQGHLLNVTTMLWLGAGEREIVTGYPTSSDWEALNASSQSGWSIILSQTCDIAAKGPGSKHPFVLCSPLKLWPQESDRGMLGDIKKWRSKYLVPITGCPEAGDWVADLRCVVPISKSLLAEQPLIPGYIDRKDQRKFADHVASKFRRAALPEVIQGELRVLLNDSVKDLKFLDSDLRQVEQIRLECLPDEVQPQQLRIHVITPVFLEPKFREPFESRREKIKELVESHGISFLGLAFDELTAIQVSNYRAWVPIDIKLLPQAWF